MMKTRYLPWMLLFCLFLPFGAVQAQNDFVTIKGTVSGDDNAGGIPFTTIYTLDGSVCTGSNEEGRYAMTLAKEGKGIKVVFSAFGYQRDTVALSKLLRHPDVRLRAGGQQLKEVSVLAYTPTGLLDEVVKRIPDNYQTDTTVNVFFSQYCRLANDSIILFYENVFESLRSGYGKFRRPFMVFTDRRKAIGSNYNHSLQSRLLVYDSAILYRMLKKPFEVEKALRYDDNRAIRDLVEIPNASYALAKRYRKKLTYHLAEFEDSTGQGYYLLTMKRRGQTTKLTINKNNLAIEKMLVWNDTATRTYPSDSTYRKYHPYAKKTYLEYRYDLRYEPINGKYTLAFFSFSRGDMNICHNEYRWKDAPTRQHFQYYQIVQLIRQQQGSRSFLDSNSIRSPKGVDFKTLSDAEDQYDETFWKEWSYVALDAAMLENLKATRCRQL